MRVSGFVMTDESGEVLAVSVGGAADLAKSLAAPKAAPESPAELVEEHKRLVDVLRSPSHADDLEEAKRQEAELAEYRDEAGEPMSKAHVKGYTRKDGTFVKEHDDSRQAEQPEQPSVRPVPSQKVFALADKHSGAIHRKETKWQHGGKKIPASEVSGFPEFSHREVYGHDGRSSPAGTNFAKEFADKGHQGFVLKHPDGKRSFVDTQGANYARYHAPVEDAPAAAPAAPAGAGAADGAAQGGASYDHPNVVGKADFGKDSPEKGFSMKFAGTEYSATGKTGNSMHDQTPVREFEAEDGHRVWADGAGRVHADSTSEVSALRQKHEASAKPAAKPKGAAPRKSAAKPAGDDAPAEGEVGHHEHTTYGVYHRPGSTVKDNYGKTHKVLEHRGSQVLMEDGTWFHPTKVHKQADKPMAKALMFVGSDASVAELAALTKVSGK